jgi:hypothetical protein
VLRQRVRDFKDTEKHSAMVRAFSSIQTAVEIRHDEKFDNGYAFNVSYKAKSGSTEGVMIPDKFTVSVPFGSTDIDTIDIDFDVFLYEPESAEQKANFQFISPNLEEVARARIMMDIEKIRMVTDEMDIPLVHGAM